MKNGILDQMKQDIHALQIKSTIVENKAHIIIPEPKDTNKQIITISSKSTGQPIIISGNNKDKTETKNEQNKYKQNNATNMNKQIIITIANIDPINSITKIVQEMKIVIQFRQIHIKIGEISTAKQILGGAINNKYGVQHIKPKHIGIAKKQSRAKQTIEIPL